MLNVRELIVAIDFLKERKNLLTLTTASGVKVQTKVLPSIRDVTYGVV